VTSDCAISIEATWTISGLVAGRPLTAGYSLGIERVGAEAVDGLRGKSYKTSGAEEAGGALDFSGIDGWRHRQL
jgi:hypothetical protein